MHKAVNIKWLNFQILVMATGNIALNFFTLPHSLKNQNQSKIDSCWSCYLAPQNIPRATVLTLGNKVLLHCCCCCWSLLYSAILRSQADSLHLNVILKVSLQLWNGWCRMKLLLSWHVLCTPHNHAPCHFMQSHKRKVHAYLAVTCHFWQKDRDLLHATAVTWGWNKYQNKNQHRKLTLEKKISPSLYCINIQSAAQGHLKMNQAEEFTEYIYWPAPTKKALGPAARTEWDRGL